MLKTPQQLNATKQRIAEFQQTLAMAAEQGPATNVSHRMHQAHLDGIRSMIESLEREVREYERLAAGDRSGITLNDWAELPRAIIQTRIARGWSQADLAREIGVKSQQVQRWEAMDNQTASFAVICSMARALGLALSDAEKRPDTQPRTVIVDVPEVVNVPDILSFDVIGLMEDAIAVAGLGHAGTVLLSEPLGGALKKPMTTTTTFVDTNTVFHGRLSRNLTTRIVDIGKTSTHSMFGGDQPESETDETPGIDIRALVAYQAQSR